TFAFWWMNHAGFAKMQVGEFSAAATWFRKAIEENRNYAWPHIGLASVLVRLGSLESAKAAMRDAIALDPNLTVRALQEKLPPIDASLHESRARYVESLRVAGMPEG